MIFSPLDDKRTFFSHLNKSRIIISFLILSSLLLWSILIQTTLKAPDEKIIHKVPEIIPISFNSDLTYINKYAEDSEKEKIIRLFSQFDSVINPEGSNIFLSISRDSPKNPKNN